MVRVMTSDGYTYGSAYRERVTLADGTEVTLRLIRSDDAPLLRDGFARLSPESRYRRFFTVKHGLSRREIEYLTNTDGEDHVAIGALERGLDGCERGLAVARFVRLRNRPDTAEVAVTVTDDAQHRGLGTLLLERLVAAACERGLTCLQFDVLADNSPMLAMIRTFAPAAPLYIEGGIVRLEICIP